MMHEKSGERERREGEGREEKGKGEENFQRNVLR